MLICLIAGPRLLFLPSIPQEFFRENCNFFDNSSVVIRPPKIGGNVQENLIKSHLVADGTLFF